MMVVVMMVVVMMMMMMMMINVTYRGYHITVVTEKPVAFI